MSSDVCKFNEISLFSHTDCCKNELCQMNETYHGISEQSCMLAGLLFFNVLASIFQIYQCCHLYEPFNVFAYICIFNSGLPDRWRKSGICLQVRQKSRIFQILPKRVRIFIERSQKCNFSQTWNSIWKKFPGNMFSDSLSKANTFALQLPVTSQNVSIFSCMEFDSA